MAKRFPFHYAWVVVAMIFLVQMLSMSVRSLPGVMMKPLEAEFGWTRASISFSVMISLLVFGGGAPMAGWLAERFSLRRVLIVGVGVTALGLALMLAMGELWQMHILWGGIVGIGTGVIGTVLGASVVNRWFNEHRGIALGIVGGAGAVGQFMLLPLMVQMASQFGWRPTIAMIALLLAAVMIPVGIFMRNRPQDVGLEPVGGARAAFTSGVKEQGTSIREALRTRDFWLLALSFFVCGFTTNGLIGTHLLPHALEHGLPEIPTAQALSFMGLMNLVGTLASGWLTDRVDNRKLLVTYYSLRGLSLLVLPFIGDMLGMYGFALVYGLDWIATVPPTVNLTAQRFGRSSMAAIYGWIYFSHMVGAAAAAQFGGVMHDIFGNYQYVFMVAAVMGIIAAGLSSRMSMDGKRKVSLQA